MSENSQIYWKVELLPHVNMKQNKFYWHVKSFHLTTYYNHTIPNKESQVIDWPASTFEGLR